MVIKFTRTLLNQNIAWKLVEVYWWCPVPPTKPDEILVRSRIATEFDETLISSGLSRVTPPWRSDRIATVMHNTPRTIGRNHTVLQMGSACSLRKVALIPISKGTWVCQYCLIHTVIHFGASCGTYAQLTEWSALSGILFSLSLHQLFNKFQNLATMWLYFISIIYVDNPGPLTTVTCFLCIAYYSALIQYSSQLFGTTQWRQRSAPSTDQIYHSAWKSVWKRPYFATKKIIDFNSFSWNHSNLPSVVELTLSRGSSDFRSLFHYFYWLCLTVESFIIYKLITTISADQSCSLNKGSFWIEPTARIWERGIDIRDIGTTPDTHPQEHWVVQN